MTTAIIIVILIVFLSIGLFFVIKKLSRVSEVDPEIYRTEAAITDFDSIPQDMNVTADDTVYKSKSEVKFTMFMSQIYQFLNHKMQSLNKIRLKYKQRQIDKIKEKEKAIQEAIQKDIELQEFEEKERQENLVEEFDTSHFESKVVLLADSKKEVHPKSIHSNDKLNPETKATNFVEQLLSEVDAVTDINSEDISDTYYYEYMEKRYIDRIVANAKDIEAYKKLGDLYVDMRNYKDALESFQYVLKLKPNDTIANRRVKDILNRLQKQN